MSMKLYLYLRNSKRLLNYLENKQKQIFGYLNNT